MASGPGFFAGPTPTVSSASDGFRVRLGCRRGRSCRRECHSGGGAADRFAGTRRPVAHNSIPADLLPENAATLIRQLPLLLPGSRAPPLSGPAMRPRCPATPDWSSCPRRLPAPAVSTSLDEFGNTALKPGAMFPAPPFDRILQNAKFKLSDYGFRFTLAPELTALGLVDANGDSNAQGFYALDFKGKWAVFSDPGRGCRLDHRSIWRPWPDSAPRGHGESQVHAGDDFVTQL